VALDTTRTTPADTAANLEAVCEDGDPALITHALEIVARAEGMTEVAKQAGVSRASLYKELSPKRHLNSPPSSRWCTLSDSR
jgi:probable addiction module antidote protein